MGLKVDYKYIRVNTIITEQDKMLIEDNIRRVLKRKKYEKITEKHDVKNVKDKIRISRKDIYEISRLGDNINSLLESISVKQISKVSSIRELIHETSILFSYSENNVKEIEEKLVERELIASTYLSKLNIMLLHCRISSINNIRFGYIRLKKILREEDKLIEGAIVELVAEGFKNVHTEIMSEINESLIEKEEFIRILKQKSESDVIDKVEEILVELYKRKIDKSFEGI